MVSRTSVMMWRTYSVVVSRSTTRMMWWRFVTGLVMWRLGSCLMLRRCATLPTVDTTVIILYFISSCIKWLIHHLCILIIIT